VLCHVRPVLYVLIICEKIRRAIQTLQQSEMLRVLRRYNSTKAKRMMPRQGAMALPSPSSVSMGLSHTRVNLIPIPPAVWRLLTVGGVFLLDAFLRAHRQQVNKMERDENNSGGGTSSSRGTGQPMCIEEAIQVLGLPEGSKVPLSLTKDVALADRRFGVLFEKSKLANSPYLQGKIVAAYEVCCGKPAPIPAKAVDEQDDMHNVPTNARDRKP
jgi:hypothetical protein